MLAADNPSTAASLVDHVALYRSDPRDAVVALGFWHERQDHPGEAAYHRPASALSGCGRPWCWRTAKSCRSRSRPLLYPVYGSTLGLGQRHPDLMPGQLVAVSGMRQRVRIGSRHRRHHARRSPTATPRTAVAGRSYRHARAAGAAGRRRVHDALGPEELDPTLPAEALRWHLEDSDGAALIADAPAGSLHLQPAGKDDACRERELRHRRGRRRRAAHPHPHRDQCERAAAALLRSLDRHRQRERRAGDARRDRRARSPAAAKPAGRIRALCSSRVRSPTYRLRQAQAAAASTLAGARQRSALGRSAERSTVAARPSASMLCARTTTVTAP